MFPSRVKHISSGHLFSHFSAAVHLCLYCYFLGPRLLLHGPKMKAFFFFQIPSIIDFALVYWNLQTVVPPWSCSGHDPSKMLARKWNWYSPREYLGLDIFKNTLKTHRQTLPSMLSARFAITFSHCFLHRYFSSIHLSALICMLPSHSSI